MDDKECNRIYEVYLDCRSSYSFEMWVDSEGYPDYMATPLLEWFERYTS